MSIRDEWATPQPLFDAIDAEFRFDVDVCATEANAKCDNYRDKIFDGLNVPWDQSNWCNPPYSNIGPWLAKGREQQRRGCLTVFLLPVDVSTKWWTEHVTRASEIRFLVGKRVQFVAPDGVKSSSNTGSSCLVIYRPGAPKNLSNGPVVRWWDWSEDVTV